MKLYDLDVSGNCYKVRLFAALTGIPLDLVPVDFSKDEQHSSLFTDLNPFQEVPVLVDGETVVRDSQAILVYLACSLSDQRWWPDDRRVQANIVGWLSVAACEIRNGPNAARLIRKFGVDLDMEAALHWSTKILPILNKHLESREWLASSHPTIADCAVFPYLSVAHEGSVDVTPFPALMAWMTRVSRLPNFIPMPGMLTLPY